MYNVTHNTQPTELITVGDVKLALAITYSDDDTLLEDLITRARHLIENYCTIAIGSQEKTWTIDASSHQEYPIPYGPVISVDDVAEKTDFNQYTSLVIYEDYDVESLLTWTPFIGGRFKIEYTTGYTTLPEGLKDAWITQVVHLYEHRGDEAQPGLCQMAKDKATPYKNYSWL